MLFSSEKGVVMVIAALLLVTLMAVAAIVIDVGQLYVTRSRLQAAADAAALAGAYSLINDRNEVIASQQAAKYVTSNLSTQYTYNPQSILATNTFTVNLSSQVKFFFAPVIGIQNSTVTASATAAANTIIGINNVVPLGVVQQQFQFGQQYTLKYGAGGGQTGNYGALALGGNGASRYRDNIKYGYSGEVKVGDVLTSEPGNMAGPTDQGVSYRKSLCTHGCSYLTQIEANCPRVVIAPVIDAFPSHGRSSVTVMGFAAFFVEDTKDSSSKGQKDVIGRFLKWSAIGEGGNGANFGLVNAKLIK
jgi:Flp pilus assembly protein TadG